jgi:hypothetical protein
MASKIEMLEGVVSHLSRGTAVGGSVQTSAISGKTSGSISSANTYSFRVDGRPVEFIVEDSISIADDDVVRVAGVVKNGHLHIYALKNMNTQAEHNNSKFSFVVIGYFSILFGILTLFILLGFVLVGCGIYIVLMERKKKKCVAMVARGTAEEKSEENGWQS